MNLVSGFLFIFVFPPIVLPLFYLNIRVIKLKKNRPQCLLLSFPTPPVLNGLKYPSIGVMMHIDIFAKNYSIFVSAFEREWLLFVKSESVYAFTTVRGVVVEI